MPETDEKTKSRETRLKEKEKVDAETQRSLAVIQMKKAHKAIEDTEKLRKRSALLSVCKRLERCVSDLMLFHEMLSEKPFGSKTMVSESANRTILFEGQMYESVRYDFQKILDIKDQDMKKLFPKIDIDEKSGFSIAHCFGNMATQMRHMRVYCERYLM